MHFGEPPGTSIMLVSSMDVLVLVFGDLAGPDPMFPATSAITATRIMAATPMAIHTQTGTAAFGPAGLPTPFAGGGTSTLPLPLPPTLTEGGNSTFFMPP